MPNDLLGSVRRALRVLDYIASVGGDAAPREIAAATSSNISTVYHVLNTLACDGYAARDDATGRYRLGHKVAPLCDAFVRNLQTPPQLQSIVRQLSDATGESAYLAILRGSTVVIADIAGPAQLPRLYVGHVAHLHATALGKAVLAYCEPAFVEEQLSAAPLKVLTPRTLASPTAVEIELARVRTLGFAEDLEEAAEGVCCLGAPFFDGQHSVYGALAVRAPALRYRSRQQTLHDAVMSAARAATDALAGDEPRRLAGGRAQWARPTTDHARPSTSIISP